MDKTREETVISQARERLGELMHDVIDVATSELDEEWTPSKKKLHRDLNQPHQSAPVWTRMLQGPMARLISDAPQHQSGMNVQILNLEVVSREEWERRRDELRQQDEADRRNLDAIDVGDSAPSKTPA